MSALREPDWATVDDFWALVEDGQKADLIDGVIYMASPDTPRNNDLANFVQFLMQGFASARKLGRVFASRVAFVLNEFRAPEPDVAFVAADRTHLVERGSVRGAPDIAVEVASRESRTRDYVDKCRLYEEAGVREYWVIDPLENRVTFFRLSEGSFEPVQLRDGQVFISEALDGFWLDTRWLTADERPSEYDCLQQILAGGPEEMNRKATDA